MDINYKNTQDITYYRYIYPHSLSKYLLSPICQALFYIGIQQVNPNSPCPVELHLVLEKDPNQKKKSIIMMIDSN